MNKKTGFYNIKGLIVITVILIAMFFVAKGMGLGAVTSTTQGKEVTYYAPNFVSYDCGVVNPNMHPDEDLFAYKPGEYTSLFCNDLTKRCTYTMKITPELDKFSFVGFNIDDCKEDGTDCKNITSKIPITDRNRDIPITTVDKGRVLRVNIKQGTGFLWLTPAQIPRGVVTITKTYDQYGLIVTGNTQLAKYAGSCKLNQLGSNYLSNIATKISNLNSVKGDASVYDPNAIPDELVMEPVANGKSYISYINNWFPTTQDFVYSYKGKEVYCQAPGVLYTFGEIGTADGKTRKLAPTTKIGLVECCPYMNGCSMDFTFTGSDAGKTCQSDLQCFGTGSDVPTGKTQVTYGKCVSGTCKYVNKTVECAYNSACSSGSYCDQATWTCKNGSTAKAFCGDGICQDSENYNLCKADCSADDKTKPTFNWTKFLIFMMLGIMGGLYAFTKAEFNGTKKQKMIFRTIVAIVVAISIFIGLPILISVLLPILGIALGLIFVVAGAFGLWFVNTTLPNSKFKMYADLALIALLLVGLYALYLGVTKFASTISIFGI